MSHQWSAADIAVRAVELLPQVFDARRVLAVQQIEERRRQSLRDVRLRLGDLAPAVDLLVRLDLDVDPAAEAVGAECGDADVCAPVGDLGYPRTPRNIR